MKAPRRPLPWWVRLTLRLVVPRTWRDEVEDDLLELSNRQPSSPALFRQLSAWPLLLAAERFRHPGVRLGDKENRMDSVLHDLRYAARGLTRNPGFALTAVATLALGIGANTAIFSLFDAVLLKSLPVEEPAALVSLEPATADGPASFSYPIFREVELRQDVFTGVFAATGSGQLRVRLDGERLYGVSGESVSGGYFEVLGVRPLRGRLLGPNDDRVPDESPVGAAIISAGFWERRFGGRDDALGTRLQIDGRDYTIVGVTPREFFGAAPGRRPDVWIPLRHSTSADSLEWRTGTFFKVMARLGPDRSLEASEQAATRLFRQLIDAETASGVRGTIRDEKKAEDYRLAVRSAAAGFDQLREAYSEALHLLTGVVGLVLLIACFNVATLLLSRAASRRYELSTRRALGSSRSRLVRQLVTEGLLLAGLGAAGGLGLAWLASSWTVSMLTVGSSAAELDIGLDARVLTFTVVVAVLTGLLFSLAPALQGTRLDSAEALSVRTGTAARPRQRLGRALVAGQLALSVLLLSGAGVLLHSLRNMAVLDVGFDRQSVIVADVGLAAGTPEARVAASRRILERLEAVPGIERASASWLNLFGRSDMAGHIELESVAPPAERITVRVNVVTPGHLAALGVPLMRGRDLSWADDAGAQQVVLVNAAFVRRYLETLEPLGRTLQLGGDERRTIVGVTGDFLWNDLRAEREPLLLIPFTQLSDIRLGAIQLRTPNGLPGVDTLLRHALEEVDPEAEVRRVHTIQARIEQTISRERLVTRLATLFSGLGLSLACIGLYGVLSYATVCRRREFGIRIALGGQRRQVVSMVLSETLRLTGYALLIGLPLTVALSGWLDSLLFGVEGLDPVSLAPVILILTALAMAAGYLPARRAASVDPADALRAE